MLYLAHNSLSIPAIQKIRIKKSVARKERFLWGENFSSAKTLLRLWTVRPRAPKAGSKREREATVDCLYTWKIGRQQKKKRKLWSQRKLEEVERKIYRWKYSGICIPLKTDRKGLCSHKQYSSHISIRKVLIGTKWCILTLSYIHWENTTVYL